MANKKTENDTEAGENTPKKERNVLALQISDELAAKLAELCDLVGLPNEPMQPAKAARAALGVGLDKLIAERKGK